MPTLLTPENLGEIDPKIRFSHLEPDTPERAFPEVMGEPLAEYGLPAIGHARTHADDDYKITSVIVNTNLKEPTAQLPREIPAPVSYSERDTENPLIPVSATRRARQPKAMVFSADYSEDGSPMGPEHFSAGKLGLSAPYTAVAPYQYVGQNWELPTQTERTMPELFSDQIPPAFIQTEMGQFGGRNG